MRRLEGKVALITGASQGIGKGIAEAFAAEGADSGLVARTTDLLKRNAAELAQKGANTLPITADVTDEQQVQAAFVQCMDRFGRLDLLINNAGGGESAPLEETSVETWERIIAANLRGPFLCTREAFRIMKKAGGGRVINIGSISGKRVRVNTAPYSTSKHGLSGLTQVAALEGRPFGISCGCLYAGNTLVERLRDKQEPMMTV